MRDIRGEHSCRSYLFLLAKLAMTKADLRIKLFTFYLWTWCTFVYADVAMPYLTKILELGAVVVRFGQATKPV